MIVYRMINNETGEILHEGYSSTFCVNGAVISSNIVTGYASANKTYYGIYSFEKIGDDGVKKSGRPKDIHTPHQKYVSPIINTKNRKKKTMTLLEELNEQARALGVSYGKYVAGVY